MDKLKLHELLIFQILKLVKNQPHGLKAKSTKLRDFTDIESGKWNKTPISIGHKLQLPDFLCSC